MRYVFAILIAVAVAGCSGTTGSGLVSFTARAAGRGAAAFDNGFGYHVTLTRADFHFGAVYLNLSRPSSGGPEQPCILPGIYVGEAFGGCGDGGAGCGMTLDLLSTTPRPFPAPGQGTANQALTAEVWLTSGDVNATDDPVPVLDVAGTATRGAQSWPFSATVTIGANRKIPPSSPAMPGSNPLCRQRIVSPIPVDVRLTDGGTLDLVVDAAAMFANVDFAALTPASDGSVVIPDAQGGVGGAFFKSVVSTGPYEFRFASK